MIHITNIKLPCNHTHEQLMQAVAKQLGIRQNEIVSLEIDKRSLDARHRPDIYYVYSLYAALSSAKKEQRTVAGKHNPNINIGTRKVYHFPYTRDDLAGAVKTITASRTRPVIVGFGPAGMFAGLMLARCGLEPIIIERGQSVDDRHKTVEYFWNTGELNLQSNVQFGEGGAGTFSDGKLNTTVRDTSNRIEAVLSAFVEAGADSSIMYINKPHIGTDVLCTVVKNIREEIIRLGGEVHFNTCMKELIIKDGCICGIQVYDVNTQQERTIDTDRLVLAIGHSSRDTFSMLYRNNVDMTAKAFAVGLRIEHPQSLINLNAYGDTEYRLPAADYKLTYQTKAGRGVYSFCMCPGGYVVNASSEPAMTAVNGMSYSGRDGDNANSALIVTVTPQDFAYRDNIPDVAQSIHPLAGVEFQRRLEKLAYNAGKSKVPVQLLGDFRENHISTGTGLVTPNIKGGYQFANLRELLPGFIGDSIAEALPDFGRKIKGYDMSEAVFSGIESRTSSPLRIIRDSNTFQNHIGGLYPCGEGAGYAGGITSAAMDGIKVAEKIAADIIGE